MINNNLPAEKSQQEDFFSNKNFLIKHVMAQETIIISRSNLTLIEQEQG
jgi:hypothetical protein